MHRYGRLLATGEFKVRGVFQREFWRRNVLVRVSRGGTAPSQGMGKKLLCGGSFKALLRL